jgi:hypothetical protein
LENSILEIVLIDLLRIDANFEVKDTNENSLRNHMNLKNFQRFQYYLKIIKRI